MKKFQSMATVGAAMLAFFTPAIVAAQEIAANGTLETLISIGYYVSTLGFVLAFLYMCLAKRQYGTSAIGSVLSYFCAGTGVFLAITIFQSLGGTFFGISDDSMDVWWHIMFYVALASFYFGLKKLVTLGGAESTSTGSMLTPNVWAIFSAVASVLVFILATPLDSVVSAYNATALSQLGLHHFLAFILAAVVGSYLFNVRKNLGQIGTAIANPMIVAIWALALQHFWELQFESWKTVDVTSEVGEGGEKIFLTITAACIVYAAWKLYSFAKGK